MQDKQQLIDLQNKIVLCLANSMQQSWDLLVINFEREVIDGERTQDTLALAFVREKDAWQRVSIIAPYKCCSLLVELSELMAKDGGNIWSSCTVEIDLSGKYRYSFNYESPKRLNGVFDDEALLKTYTPRSF